MPTDTAELLGKVEDAKQYPAAMPDGGRTGFYSSSYSESWNNSIAEARKLPMAQAFEKAIVLEHGRFIRAKDAAEHCEATVPPRVNEAQTGCCLAATRIDISKVSFVDATKNIALVPGLENPDRKFKVNLKAAKDGGAAACDGLCMNRTLHPCVHVRAACTAADKNILDIMNPGLTTVAYKAQYAGLDFPMPSKAEIDAESGLINRNICLHPALKRPKGRPKKEKRKKGPLSPQEGSKNKRRKMTCSVCYKEGHTKKCCPYRPVPFAVGEAPWAP